MKPYSATPAVRMTPLAERAVAKLDAWLREDNSRTFSNVIEELREAVEHFTECDGMDKTCAGTTDECEDQDPQGCAFCATPCEDCRVYKTGQGGTWSATRSALSLVEEVEAREAALFEVA